MIAATLVDARGLRCPVPVARARAAIATIAPGEALHLLADDPLARLDVRSFCAREGHDYLGEREEPGGGWRMTLRRGRRAALAIVRFGEAPGATEASALEVRLPIEALTPDPPEEVWLAEGEVAPVEVAHGSGAADGRSVFAAVAVPVDGDATLAAQTREAYASLLHDLRRAGYPHPLRIWNFVPRINARSGGLDRYMRFCEGRSEAFVAHCGGPSAERLPAASAVGSSGDALVIHALASRRPGRHVENPRQIPAYRYPPQYGPASPTFARATTPPEDGVTPVLVSGTASIVGHESRYPGDPGRQVAETIRNIASILDAAGVPGPGGPVAARLISMRVYVRHPEHLGDIRSALAAHAGGDVPTAWLHAEICRPELLVEIEALARPASARFDLASPAGSS